VECVRTLNADRGVLFLNDPDGETFHLEASVGLSPAYLEAVARKWKKLPGARFVCERQSYFSRDVLNDPLFECVSPEIEAEGFRSIAFFPLPGKEAPIGNLVVYFDSIRDFSSDEQAAIHNLTELAAIAVENGRLYNREKRASGRLERLQELALQVSSSLDLREVLEAIAKATVELLDGSQSRIYLLERGTERLLCKASYGITSSVQDAPDQMKLGIGVGGEVASRRTPFISPDVQQIPKWLNASWTKAHNLHSFIGVPLLSSGKALGLINCLSSRVDHFTEGDLRLLESLAAHAVAAIEKAQLYSEVERRAEHLKVLDEIAKAINSTLDLGDLFKVFVDRVKRLMPCSACALYTLDESSKMITDFWLVDDKGHRGDWIASRLNLAGSHFEEIFKTHKPFYVPDTRESEYARLRSLSSEGLLSVVTIPILNEGGTCVGVLNIGSEEVDDYSKEHAELLVSVADHLAVALRQGPGDG
jgi:GAF domain-containing protein